MFHTQKKIDFAVKQLTPYFEDPSICGFEEGLCTYLSSEGKKCVFGKNLKKYKKGYEGATAKKLLGDCGEDILIESSRGILSADEWSLLQNIHDRVAKSTYHKTDKINIVILKDKLISSNLLPYFEKYLDKL